MHGNDLHLMQQLIIGIHSKGASNVAASPVAGRRVAVYDVTACVHNTERGLRGQSFV